MTANEFKRELCEGLSDCGYARGARVLVNGRIGTVLTKIVRNRDSILQSVKFDEPDEAGKFHGSFPHTELFPAAAEEGAPSEVDLLGQRIRRT